MPPAYKMSPARKAHRVRRVYQPDEDHAAWVQSREEGLPEPTPATCPDAFFSYMEPVTPRQTFGWKRKLRDQWSRTALRKRLSRAGLRGEALRQALHDFWNPPRHQGPAPAYLELIGPWYVTPLKAHFGRRISHAILHGVRVRFVFLDEWASYLGTATMDGIHQMMREGRKTNGQTLEVTQSFEDMGPSAQGLVKIFEQARSQLLTLPEGAAP